MARVEGWYRRSMQLLALFSALLTVFAIVLLGIFDIDQHEWIHLAFWLVNFATVVLAFITADKFYKPEQLQQVNYAFLALLILDVLYFTWTLVILILCSVDTGNNSSFLCNEMIWLEWINTILAGVHLALTGGIYHISRMLILFHKNDDTVETEDEFDTGDDETDERAPLMYGSTSTKHSLNPYNLTRRQRMDVNL